MIPTNHIAGDADINTVVVGVKMDALSRELLTWSLVKVAQPGDVVIALHVLAKDGKFIRFFLCFFFMVLIFWVFLKCREFFWVCARFLWVFFFFLGDWVILFVLLN